MISQGGAVQSGMLDLAFIARLEEARQAQGMREVAREWRAWGGGAMCRSEPGNWINQVAGAGFAGPVTREQVAEMVAYYTERGIEPRVEVAPFADPSLVNLCAEAGFVVRVFESVFFREVAAGEVARGVVEPPAGLRVERVDVRDAAAVRRFCEVAMSGFYPPGMTPTEDEIATVERSARHPRTVCVMGWMGNEPAAAGAMEVAEIEGVRVSGLFGLSVRPEFRRRGIQQALIAARLNIAAEAGARVAMISSRPGVATERNVRRMGFQVAYTKVILVKPGEGLVGVRT